MKQRCKYGELYKIPNSLADQYRGCGNGYIVVNKHTDEVELMSYADDGETIKLKQNVLMCQGAGTVLSETKKQITYRANFSCGDACLF